MIYKKELYIGKHQKGLVNKINIIEINDIKIKLLRSQQKYLCNFLQDSVE